MKLRRLRDKRTRTLQTLLFGTVRVAAPRVRVCSCLDTLGMGDLSFSPLASVLPDRCTAELRRLHADLGARHSFREAARLLKTFLPCSPPNHVSVRNRLHRVANVIEEGEAAPTLAPADSGHRRTDDGDRCHDRWGAHPRRIAPREPPSRRDGRQSRDCGPAAASLRAGTDGCRAAGAGHPRGTDRPGLATGSSGHRHQRRRAERVYPRLCCEPEGRSTTFSIGGTSRCGCATSSSR